MNYIQAKQIIKESLSTAIFVGGITTGALISAIINKYKNRLINCKEISDPYIRDECTLKIIDSLIKHLELSKRECEQTPNPNECVLALINKQDKLLNKKLKIQKNMNKIERIRNKIQTD